MIDYEQGDLLKADVEALVNTVNCVGAMGKGIALQFRQAYPEIFAEYARACRNGEVKLGQMFTVSTGKLTDPHYIINFPTKNHWREPSRIDDIRTGLIDLVAEIKRLEIRSIAIPPLGCGNGGLRWSDVRPLIEQALAEVPDIHVLLFAPQAAPEAEKMTVATKKPNMTRGRALVIRLMEMYGLPGYRLTLLEVQKLAYLLQESGLPMKLNYVRHRFGPYAENLNPVLQRIEGHFIRGYGDRTKQTPGIYIIDKSPEDAHKFLNDDDEAREHLERVARLIEGFETPYGMELLASVHWVVEHENTELNDLGAVIAAVHKWNPRKHRLFSPEHIGVAWKRLREENWLTAKTSFAPTEVHKPVA
jgi:O-acetyl-ADP-ribose deacetylase (regulator of RNase III)